MNRCSGPCSKCQKTFETFAKKKAEKTLCENGPRRYTVRSYKTAVIDEYMAKIRFVPWSRVSGKQMKTRRGVMIIEITRTIYACTVTLAATEPRESRGKLKIPRPILISNRTRNERIDRVSNSPITPQTSGYVGPGNDIALWVLRRFVTFFSGIFILSRTPVSSATV